MICMTTSFEIGRFGHLLAADLDPARWNRRAMGENNVTTGLAELARLARTFHGAGFFHKDFYLGHILLREEGGEFALFLIDLQRTDRHPRPRRRWFVKDLAQMLYTTPSPPIQRTDLVRFFRLYRGVPRLGRDDRRFIGAIVAKHRRMVRRVERKGPIRDW